MQEDQKKIVLLPTVEKKLKENIIEALEEKEFSIALEMMEKLLHYGIGDFDLFDAKLLCLLELGEYDQAEDWCLKHVELYDENYYKYLHHYISILFQMKKFDRILQKTRKALKNDSLPADLRREYVDLYAMVMEIQNNDNKVEKTELLKDFNQALTDNDPISQWRAIKSLTKLQVSPPEKIISSLKEEQIHPVVKTAIFKWLIDRKISDPIQVQKFNQKIEAIPTYFTTIEDHQLMKAVLLELKNVEQNNPSLFQLIEKLLYRYIYVYFPILPSSEEAKVFAEALFNVGLEHMQLKATKKPSSPITHYMREIIITNKMYLEVIETYG